MWSDTACCGSHVRLIPEKGRDDSVARALHQLKGSVYPTGMGWMAGWGPLGHLYGKRYWTPGLPGVTRKPFENVRRG